MTTPDPSDPKTPAGAPKERDAKDELFDAIDHFKNAAQILFQKARRDPMVHTAATEAERVLQKIGETAEPLAKQLTDELTKLTKKISETVDKKRPSARPGDPSSGPSTKPPDGPPKP